MLKKGLYYWALIVLLTGCSGLKTAFTGNKPAAPAPAATVKKETKFLEQIDVPVEGSTYKVENKTTSKTGSGKKETTTTRYNSLPSYDGENLSYLQIRYAVLLNAPAEDVQNTRMFEFIDDWYGTPYRLGGNTKKGIDCSAFTQFLFSGVYGISIPRTVREQYSFTHRISKTELKEGDLIFFNTRGSVSHVGVYLQNNKFVHASTSGGVMISDIFDAYWERKFVGVGRMKSPVGVVSSR